MKKSSLLLSAVILGASLSSCGLKKEKSTVIPPVKVEVMAAAGDSLSASRQYAGTIQSGDGADMRFTVAGTLKAIYVEPGQKVSKGQLLAEIDAATLQNVAQAAEATLAQAQDAYARLKKLHDANALPDIQWVEVQSKLRQAENSADIARRAVGDARIYSPVNGIVSEKLADIGQTVAPAVPVVKIVSIGDVKVSISVPETEIAIMRPGTKAVISSDALSSGSLEALLTEQGVVANPLSRTYDVKFKVSNQTGELRPGMLCTVEVAAPAVSHSSPVILPPGCVLLSADNRQFVWLATKGRAERRFVETGKLLPEGIEISSGIMPGDTVIVAGMQKVCNGTNIQY